MLFSKLRNFLKICVPKFCDLCKTEFKKQTNDTKNHNVSLFGIKIGINYEKFWNFSKNGQGHIKTKINQLVLVSQGSDNITNFEQIYLKTGNFLIIREIFIPRIILPTKRSRPGGELSRTE